MSIPSFVIFTLHTSSCYSSCKAPSFFCILFLLLWHNMTEFAIFEQFNLNNRIRIINPFIISCIVLLKSGQRMCLKYTTQHCPALFVLPCIDRDRQVPITYSSEQSVAYRSRVGRSGNVAVNARPGALGGLFSCYLLQQQYQSTNWLQTHGAAHNTNMCTQVPLFRYSYAPSQPSGFDFFHFLFGMSSCTLGFINGDP